MASTDATEGPLKSWKISALDTSPHEPQVLSSSDESRAIVLELPAGESLDEHEVHERAWLILVSGELVVHALGDPSRESVEGGPGLLVEFDPGERHRVEARSDARFVLILTPWPGKGHPGALTLEQKAHVRERAAEQNAQSD